jgi:hypothetical protein
MEVPMIQRSLLAGAVALATVFAPLVHAQTTQPGFVPDTGQINPGGAPHPPSASPSLPIADQEAVRAALLTPDPGTISTGEQPNAAGKPQPETTGKGITAGETPGPIASTMQTKPAKFSHRNDAIDHTPTMAMPFRLDDAQRKQIVQAVLSESTPAFSGTRDFKPADVVPFSLAGSIHPLPEGVRDLPDMGGLAFLRSKNKVYLISTTTADPIVVDVLAAK